MTSTAAVKLQQDVEAEVRVNRTANYWYRGEHCNYNPTQAEMREHDAIERYILKGWTPPAPFIDRGMRIASFGSCFAQHVAKYLNARNYNLLGKSYTDAYVVGMSDSLVNSYAIRGQFEWAFENVRPTMPLWHGYKGELFGYHEHVRQQTLQMFNQTDIFILTFGLSEVWYDEPTGEVFWRAVPQELVDPTRHKFRVTSVAENRANIRAIYDLIRKHRPDAKLICSLSPVPLVATFRPESCLTANSVSKAVLRAAIDEVYREVGSDGHLFYWPSYEIVTEGFGASPYGGKFIGDRRHVKTEVIDYIMRLFEEHYCVDRSSAQTVLAAYVRTRCTTGDMPAGMLPFADANDSAAVRQLADLYLNNGDRETAEAIVRFAMDRHPAAGYEAMLPSVERQAPQLTA